MMRWLAAQQKLVRARAEAEHAEKQLEAAERDTTAIWDELSPQQRRALNAARELEEE